MNQAVAELESAHKKLKLHYEEEIKNLKLQLQQAPEKEEPAETPQEKGSSDPLG